MRKARCYLLDLAPALGRTRWLNPRELVFLLPLQTSPRGYLNCHVTSPSPLHCYFFFKRQFGKCCGFFVEKTLWHQQNLLRKWQLKGVRSWLRLKGEVKAGPFPLILTPLILILLQLSLHFPPCELGAFPWIHCTNTTIKLTWRRKAFSLLSVLLNWEIRILSCRFLRLTLHGPAPPVLWCILCRLAATSSRALPPLALVSVAVFRHYLEFSLPRLQVEVVVLWIKIGALASGKCKFIWKVSCVRDQML